MSDPPAPRTRRRGPAARLERFSLVQVFAAVVGGLLVLAALGLVAGLFALDRLSDSREQLVDRISPAAATAERLTTAYLDQETGVRGYAISGQPSFLEPYRRGRRDEGATLEELDRLTGLAGVPGAPADLADIRRRARAWRAGYVEPALRAGARGDAPDLGAGKLLFDALRVPLARLRQNLGTARATARDELEQTAGFVSLLFVLAGAVTVAGVAIAALALRRGILLPLGALARDADRVALGDFDHRVTPAGPREVAVLARDVDAMRERIVAETHELQRSNLELEQFAYVASHDLQEPLRKVASFTQMLQRRYEGQLDERADRYIEFAVDGARRMQQLINDLLDFSRVERMTRPFAPVDCGELVDAARARLSPVLEESGGEVVVGGELPTVTGDAGLLGQVFQNLIANAIKFRGSDPSRVVIDAVAQDGAWRLSCTDNGLGIEDAYADRIFVIFQRLHTREAYEGTGIGLSMCRKIVEYHGGRIWLAPADPDRGARFEFTLPHAHDPEETADEPA